MQNDCGIYALLFDDGDVYIGSSATLAVRLARWDELLSGRGCPQSMARRMKSKIGCRYRPVILSRHPCLATARYVECLTIINVARSGRPLLNGNASLVGAAHLFDTQSDWWKRMKADTKRSRDVNASLGGR